MSQTLVTTAKKWKNSEIWTCIELSIHKLSLGLNFVPEKDNAGCSHLVCLFQAVLTFADPQDLA